MDDGKHDLWLKGCLPVPLSHYLKALGVLRLVSEQVDSEARGYWVGDDFHLLARLDDADLARFLLDDYRPTPIVAPWNGGSGFYLRDRKEGIDAIHSSDTPRLEDYRNTIAIAFSINAALGLEVKPDKEIKQDLLEMCRSRLPDGSIGWLDATYVITQDDVKYPPLLGTGGNDGRLDFSNNFMQRLCEVMDPGSGEPTPASSTWLEGALHAFPIDGLRKGIAIGQFHPMAVGGANATSGFNSDSLVNPWEYILMMEGAMLFAAASVKRLGTHGAGALSYPFRVRTTGAGYGTAAAEDVKASRAELWIPIWERPISLRELSYLMAEGRAQLGRRAARDGLDFAMAIAALGVDRGITAFQRYGFLERNGMAFFATPLNRFKVRRQPQVDLLADIDGWLQSYKSRASSERAPASVGRALRQLEEGILSLCRQRGARKVQDVLVSLGSCERTLARSLSWTVSSRIHPVPALSPRWLSEAYDSSPEYRLAANLASIYGAYSGKTGRSLSVPLRAQMEPVRTWVANGHLRVVFDEEAQREVVWSEGDPIDALCSIMAHRLTRAIQSGATTYLDRGRIEANLGDVANLVEGRLDVHRMGELLSGLILLDWPAVTGAPPWRWGRTGRRFPGAGYGLLKLCFPGRPLSGQEIPLVPEIFRRVSSGDGSTATRLASRRLRGCGLVPALEGVDLSRDISRRTAAAILLPLGEKQLTALAARVLRFPQDEMFKESYGSE